MNYRQIITAALAALCVAACGMEDTAQPKAVENVTLETNEIELKEGAAFVLEYAISPEDADNQNVTWESSDDGIASVSSDGTVTAVSAGQATVTVITEDGNKKDRCNVIVTAVDHPVEDIRIDPEEYELEIGKSFIPEVIFTPENATDKTLVWESSDNSVASVTAKGEVIGLAEGQVTITAVSEKAGKSAECHVTVFKPEISVESISLDYTEIEIYVDGNFQLTATILPENATNRNIVWSSSDESVAVSDQDGNITGKAIGQATITATSEDGGRTATCQVSVIGKPLPDYIDQDGVNHGQGVKIGELIWAPVNCGYKAPEGSYKGYPYGKLYQYGRKDGQGYKSTQFEDETTAIISSTNPSSIDEADPDTFYTKWDETIAPDGTWGGEDGKTKTQYDPCPEGWRVPTLEELKSLRMDAEDLTEGSTYKNKNTLHETFGRWFGPNHPTATYESPNGCIFLQFAGYREQNSNCSERSKYGYYITSDGMAVLMASFIVMPENPAGRDWGFSVRCVRE